MRVGQLFSGLATLVVAATMCAGQVELPNCFIWQDNPRDENDDYVNTHPKFAPTITVTLGEYDISDCPYCLQTPEETAEAVATAIRAAMTASPTWLTYSSNFSNINILLRNFGHALTTTDTDLSDAGYFDRPADEEILNDSTHEFPLNRGDRAQHPFLHNATTDGKLRSWVADFANALDDLRVVAGQPTLPNPNTYRFYFDTETSITDWGSANSVHMLWWIYTNRQDIWTGWTVPGSPGWVPAADHENNTTGQTLATMYSNVKVANGWPPDQSSSPNLASEVNVNDFATASANMRFMIWWYSVCEIAREGVMKASVYDQIHAVWPDARVGNYQAANYDGQTDTTGWFYNKAGQSSYQFPLDGSGDPDFDAWDYQRDQLSLVGTMPRCWFDRQPASVLLNPANANDRWQTVRMRAYGDVDSPQLYPLNDGPNSTDGKQWRGNSTAGSRGHWSLNPYVPAETPFQFPYVENYWWPYWSGESEPYWTPLDETQAQTRLRLDRHTVESIINSLDDNENAEHQDRLAPWVNELCLLENDGDVFARREREQRMVLAMLRAKRVP